MRIFKKRAYSVSRGFEGLVVEDEEDEVQRYAGQVDLNDKPICSWIFIGFWSGNLITWSTELTYTELWIIYGSDSFSENVPVPRRNSSIYCSDVTAQPRSPPKNAEELNQLSSSVVSYQIIF